MILYHTYQRQEVFSFEQRRLFHTGETPKSSLPDARETPISVAEAQKPNTDINFVELGKQAQNKKETLNKNFNGKLPEPIQAKFGTLETHLSATEKTAQNLQAIQDLLGQMDQHIQESQKPETEKDPNLDPKNPNLLDNLKQKLATNGDVTEESKEDVAEELTMEHIDVLAKTPQGREFLQSFFIENSVVNFHGNDELEQKVGLGEIMPKSVDYLIVNGRPAKRVEGLRPYYENQQGKYVKIFDGYKVEIPTAEQIAQNKESWKFPSEGKDIRAEQMANLKTSNPDLFAKIEAGESVSKESFFSTLRETKALNKSEWKVSREEREQQRNMQFTEYVQNALGFKDFTEVGEPASKAKLQETVDRFGFSQVEKQHLLATFHAIAEQESGNKYNVLGQMLTSGSFADQRALGKHQIMPGNWNEWSIEALGDRAAPTAENQDIVALYKMARNFKTWLNKGNNPEQATALTAVNWYGNNGKKLRSYADINTEQVRTVAGKTFPSPKQYAESVVSKARRNINTINIA